MRLPTAYAARALLGYVLAPSTGARAASVEPETASSIERGPSLFFANCSICHGVNGDGVPGVYPPLAKSDWLARHRSGAIRAVVNGLKEEDGHRCRGRHHRRDVAPRSEGGATEARSHRPRHSQRVQL